ncbi:DnaA/Hda family protein [Roseinatronobacter bogoriensis]|nr:MULTISPECIES: DnaA/Hda family protein [Rhodobaca]MBB4206870.1 DnaA regulatory inactivator Hda [Rhodobaca bogoriensis DSM 18756]TDW41613.1 DnaA regulatory inactivator Hda [Rhodobaca barguzinensis]TDY74208.1 DnaA regulatory inactivator Hda [Rhodobaca bogoriensis DSM 18756]
MPRPTQIHMPLDLPARHSRDSFVPAPCNAHALAMLGQPEWPAGKLVLCGPEGAGKTHLLHIWADEAGAQLLSGDDLVQADLAVLAQAGAVAIDDAASVARTPEAQTALFHLHNMLAERKGRLLLAARAPVRDWGIRLPDLASRLQACAHVSLAPPDDTLLAAVLTKLFADRQVRIPDNLIPFLLPRMERSLAGAQAIVALLDAEALARKKPISRALAADVMQSSFDLD